MADSWLPSLKASTPQEGFEFAGKLARPGVKLTQPSAEVRAELRPDYDHDAGLLIAASQVIAGRFQTVAAANHYRRS